MAAITWKCPNCGGELVFEPSIQKYKCPFCESVLTQEELEEMNPAHASEQEVPEEEAQANYAADQGGTEENTAQTAPGGSGRAVVYSCPSCGAEVVTDETTAATFCYYCHNPVVLEGRISGDYLPDKIIPFQIDRKAAEEKFREYVRKKKFVPRAFYDDSQVEKLSGVYYPYWVYDAQMDADVEAEAKKIRIWRAGDTEYTETSTFRIFREGQTAIGNITENALSKSDRALVENVQPFDLSDMKPFTMGYLSGFLAEKRDMEKEQFQEKPRGNIREYSETMIRDTMSGYTGVRMFRNDYRMKNEHWQYVLLPVWVLTYRAGNGKMYYYALNGQTGNVCGILPVDYSKLALWCLGLGAAAAAAAATGFYFI